MNNSQRENMKRNGFKYLVAGYYASTVKPPKKARDLALEVVHETYPGAVLEKEIFEQRKDIGYVIMEEL
jgi:hypothetical protein